VICRVITMPCRSPSPQLLRGQGRCGPTPWLEYFLSTLAETFESVRKEARRLAAEGVPTEPEPLGALDRRARIVLGCSRRSLASPRRKWRPPGLSERMARVLLTKWVEDGG